MYNEKEIFIDISVFRRYIFNDGELLQNIVI